MASDRSEKPTLGGGRVVALAGRRIDAEDATEKHFPLDRVPQVRTALRQMFVNERAGTLVSSAACGADLLALDVAGDLRLRRRVILPFDRLLFRTTSVIDRPGDWGTLYDRILDAIEAAHELIVMPPSSDRGAAYLAANDRILDEAAAVCNAPPLAVLVWDGVSRNGSDVTAAFRRSARQRGFAIVDVATL